MTAPPGLPAGVDSASALAAYVNLKLALLGCQPPASLRSEFADVVSAVVAQYREKDRLLSNHLCPADERIQTFLYDYLQDVPVAKLPLRALALDRPGMARLLSLPVDRDEFKSDIVTSYRVRQGVLHNPKADRRTTHGLFHVVEGGLPIPADKRAAPKAVFGKLLSIALSPPPELLRLPFTSTQPAPAECFVSMLLRPLISPGVPGMLPEKRMEIRFFAPGNLVSNLDFVETIFGNAGDPGLPENDAGLDVEHWTGHTGCVILAPHLNSVTKKAAGLPEWKEASERQRRDGMCWREETELYNEGGSFKLTCRDETGVIVTLISDNYYGYCKKEVKTQISYAANLLGLCEEEHAGGALVFPSYDLGEEFSGNVHVKPLGHSFAEVTSLYADRIALQEEGYGVDKRFPEICYVPENARFELHPQKVVWKSPSGERSIPLLPDKIYIRPSGYKVRMERPSGNRGWRLIGTVSEGLLCHKPCTVSGGGKSEISKSLSDAILQGPVFVADLQRDFDRVEALLRHDYSVRFHDQRKTDGRPILSPERSLGSVIRMLTPHDRDYRAEYNRWLESIPQYIKELVFVVKRYHQAEWGADWRSHFSVDTINGHPAHELKWENRHLVSQSLRVGFDERGLWRTFGLRKDFHPAAKVQWEDDITASVLVPSRGLPYPPGANPADSFKFVQNCEQRLFQRPDDAIHRGYDKQTEADFARSDGFFSNYEPLTSEDARALVEDSIGLHQFTEPMRELARAVAAEKKPGYFVSPAHPRRVDNKPSQNPRYLQLRPDLVNPREAYVAEMGARLRRRAPLQAAVLHPVGAVLPGRRNNPPEGRIRSLAVFNPIHYVELPELFMEFICSMTGKSPSTTGAGSEGALTKGPFNALPPMIDLNNALVAWILAGHEGFVTAAGHIGPRVRVGHDISLLMPELWCRMTPEERRPSFLIENQYLEKCRDFERAGKPVLASRLGYRINARFVHAFFARVFNHPHSVFTDEMLRPELQDLDLFADGMDNIVTTQKRVAEMYFEDGGVACACPPLQALLHIMATGSWEGRGLDHPGLRSLFSRDRLLASDWYASRLAWKQEVDRRLWRRHDRYLDRFLKRASHADEAKRLGIAERLRQVRETALAIESPAYLEQLLGTIGAEPISKYTSAPAAAWKP